MQKGVSAVSVENGPVTTSGHGQLDVVSDKGVILANGALTWSDGTVTSLANLGANPQLQQGAPTGRRVLVATDDGLSGVADGSLPVVLERIAGVTAPVRPATDTAGCAFGAWGLPSARLVEACPNGTHVDSTLQDAHGWGGAAPLSQFSSLVFRVGGTDRSQ